MLRGGGYELTRSCDALLRGSRLTKAIVDNKVGGMERLCTSCVQLALHRWQLLPRVHTGCRAHKPLLHLFHQVSGRRCGRSVRESTRSEARFLSGVSGGRMRFRVAKVAAQDVESWPCLLLFLHCE